jgi:Zn-dependent protease
MEFLLLLPLLVAALTVHEFAHAFTAYKLGDATPKIQGRVTLNPLAHLDPIGTLVLIVTSFLGMGFGWGKPVSFNPYNLRHPKRDIGLVAFAGPLANILMAIVGIILLTILSNQFVQAVLVSFILINCVLAIFNLVPIYPLDGYNVVMSILPPKYSQQFGETAQYGTVLLLVLIFSGATRVVINPVIGLVMRLIEGVLK